VACPCWIRSPDRLIGRAAAGVEVALPYSPYRRLRAEPEAGVPPAKDPTAAPP
jgi:hypothetical protein